MSLQLNSDEASPASVASPPSLSTVVPYFITARRALLCWEQVSLAKTLVRSTKDAIESQFILNSRTTYIRNGCQAQLETIKKVDTHSVGTRDVIREQWDTLVARVDIARKRLEATAGFLRSIKVEEKLISKEPDEEDHKSDDCSDESDEEKVKSLYDFVEQTHANLCLGGIDTSMESIFGEITMFEKSIGILEKEAIEVNDMLEQSKKLSDVSNLTQGNFTQHVDLLQAMEQQAVEMANNLEGIVKQFDNCVLVMRHIEGGGAAVMEIAQETPAQVGLESAMGKPLEELTEGALRNLIIVIGKNHTQVDLVVAEIKAGLDKVQAISNQISLYSDRYKEEFQTVVKAFHLLEEVGNKLPTHITQGELHAIRWEEEISKIDKSLVDLESLRDHWMEFRQSYDYLLVEAGRQRDFERRAEKQRKDFVSKMDKMMEEEKDTRAKFNDDHGLWLPRTICSALSVEPPRYEMIKMENACESVPDISASVINRAIKRIQLQQEKQHAK